MLESNPLKSRFLVGRLGADASARVDDLQKEVEDIKKKHDDTLKINQETPREAADF